mmetsp:Transcript_26366/g.84482  ORF Transcript_26366/g.84482 Transcript_26366/m.84482 type:complete len:105 (-) Transcript_26366:789-1103(-)
MVKEPMLRGAARAAAIKKFHEWAEDDTKVKAWMGDLRQLLGERTRGGALLKKRGVLPPDVAEGECPWAVYCLGTEPHEDRGVSRGCPAAFHPSLWVLALCACAA